MEEITVPELGKVDRVTLVTWHVQEGTKVDEGTEIAEVESMKTSFTIDSPAAGKISSIIVDEGRDVEPGETIAHLSSW